MNIIKQNKHLIKSSKRLIGCFFISETPIYIAFAIPDINIYMV